MRLKDKVSIITGAASGIGKATSLVFAREGAKVMCADVNAGGAEAVARQIVDTGGEAESIKVDVSVEADVKNMISQTVARWGRLDILYNNAGIGYGMPVTQVPESEWDRLMDINLKVVFLGCKHAIQELLKNGGVPGFGRGVIHHRRRPSGRRRLPGGTPRRLRRGPEGRERPGCAVARM